MNEYIFNWAAGSVGLLEVKNEETAQVMAEKYPHIIFFFADVSTQFS